MKVNIAGLDPAVVLAALNAAAIAGALHGGHKNTPPIDADDAAEMLRDTSHFDYVQGRAMHLTFDGSELDVSRYDEANRMAGPSLAAGVVKRLRGSVNAMSDDAFAGAMASMGALEMPR